MHSSLKISAALLVNFSFLCHEVFAQLPPITFETYESQSVDLSSPDPWDAVSGSSTVTPAGEGFGGGKALKIGVDPQEEAWLRKPVSWNPAETIAFIDFRIKPAATPSGSQANFFANGTQLAFQIPANSTNGELWVLHGNDDAVANPPGSPVPPEKWYQSAGTFTVPQNSPVATTWLRATLRHDYQRKIWDLFIDGKLAAVNLGFEGRGANLEHLEFFGSLAGDTLLDNLEANPSNMLFPDADKDGLPDAWEIANGSNPNLYDRDAIDPATGKSFLNKYLDSLWNAQSPGTPVNGSAGLGNVGSVPPLTILGGHQPVGALKGQFAVGGDGAATYTIPIDIPKGRAGMEPKLSINYSSNAGNGPLGVGWSIGGLQKITRGPSSLKKDGIADGADFDANDRFYLDGERLVCIDGTYGKIGSEYRTEMDSFARIKAVGLPGDLPTAPPAYWTVETKSGLKMTLGGKADSRVEISGAGVLSWLVSEVADTTGRNAYQVDYCDNAEAPASSTSSGRYPSKVRYTIDPTIGSDTGFCSMSSDYEGRPDQSSGYVHGVKQEALLRLKQVAVKTGNHFNHAYNFFYTTSGQTGRSLLNGVDKEAADGSRVPATSFQWDTLSHGAPKWVEAGHLDFNEYGSGQDSGRSMASYVSVSQTDPTEIHLTGNAWRTYPISDDPQQPTYAVTPNTWLEFKYRTLPDSVGVSGKPRWGMIGLDEDALTANPRRVFKIVGGALPPIPTYNSSSWEYTRTDGQPDTIRIHVGQHFTGQMRHLVLVSDDNTVSNGAGESWFSNVRLFEGSPTAGGVLKKSFHFDQAIAAPRILDGNNEDLGVRIQDMDGDGLPDIAYNLLYGKTSGTGAVTLQTFGQALRNTGSEFVNDASLKLPPTIPTGNLPGAGEGQFANSQAIYPVPVDINSDGQLDYAFAKNLKRENDGTFTCEHGYLTRENNAWVELTAYAHHFTSNCATSQKRFSHFEHIDLDSDGDLDLLVHSYGAKLALLPGRPNTTPLASFPIIGNSGGNDGVAYLNKFHEGQGWVGSSEWRLPVPLRIPGFNSNGGEVGRSLQDLNGDGRPDLYSALWQLNKNVWLNKDGANGWEAKDSGSIYQIPENLTNSTGDDVGTRLVDVNGDGKVDVIKALGSGSMDLAKGVHLNTGKGWFSETASPIPWLPQENFNTIDKRGEVQEQGTSFVDLNADGLVDFVVSKPSRDTVFLNTGGGWSAEDQTVQPSGYKGWKLPSPTYPNTTASTNGIRHAMLVDLNGDGVSDLIGETKSAVPKIWINKAKPERIVAFTDGFAASIQVNTYARLNDPTPVPNSLGLNRRVYDKTPVSDGDSNTTWDRFLPGHVSLCDNRWVVARYSEPDGNGGRRYRSQYYRDLRHDKTNEASLGFGQIEVHDEVTRGYTVTQTRRDYPFAGSVHLTRSYAFVGTPPAGETNPLPSQPGIGANTFHLVSEEAAGYAQLAATTGIGSINGAQHFVYRPVQTLSIAKKFELGDPVNPVSRVTTAQNLGDFDGFGFVKKSTVTALDGSSTETESAYWHDTNGKWLLGRLAASRVKKTYGGASTTKTSGFAYRSGDGLLVKEVIEPKDLPSEFGSGIAPSNYDPVAAVPVGLSESDPGHPGGVEKTYVLDDFGNTLMESVKAYTNRGTATQTRTKHTEWGHNGRFPVREDTDGLGGTQDTVHTYDSARALITSSTDIDGRATYFRYDSFGTQIATDRPDGTSTAEITRYVVNGDLPSDVVQATAGATLRWARRAQASGTPWATVYFDSLGREIVTEKLVLVSLSNGRPHFENQYVVNCFDTRGRNYRTSNPFFAGDQPHWTILHHDALDRVYKTTRPDTTTEGIQSIAVEAPGTLNPLSKIVTYDAKGNQLQRWTDQHGRMVKSSDASGQETTFAHDPEGRVKSVSIGGAEQLANHFDIVGNKWKVVDLSGGTSTSVTNGFGEVISATNPHGTIGTLYDHLGRVSVVTKLEGVYTTTYNQSSPALGAPDRIDGSGAAAGYMEDFFYGSSTAYEYGKVIEVRKRQSSAEPTYVSRTAYNALGLVMDEWFDGELNPPPNIDPTLDDAHVRHEYDPVFGSFELRTKLFRGAHQTLLSETGGLTISGNEATATGMLAHGILRKVTTDIRNGRILRIESDQGSIELQHLTYAWDSVGNLLSRQDAKAGKTEVFEYDGLNRLKKSTIDSQSPVEFEYETNGNLKSKAGSPNRTYVGYQVETAVVKGQTRHHTYDAAGYLDKVREDDASGIVLKDLDWTSFGQLKQVNQTSTPKLETFAATQTYAANGIPGLAAAEVYLPSQAVAQFDFDASGSRAKQTLTRNFGLGSEKRCVTRYLGTYESEVHEAKPGNGSYALDKILHRHRLGGALLTTEVPYSNGVAGSPLTRLAVVLTDHIGSTDVIVRGDWTGNGWNLSANQQKAERQSFDAWGGGRDQTTWTDLHPAHDSTRKTSGFDQDRGFTGHEMLDDFGLVHMNGRIYDSDLGRFLSPDPYVQVPEYSQNFNRYSYVLNNPLSYTDPSGNIIYELIAKESPEAAGVINSVIAAVLTPYIGVEGAAVVKGLADAYVTVLNGGDAGDAAISGVVGAFQAYAGTYVGTSQGWGLDSLAKLTTQFSWTDLGNAAWNIGTTAIAQGGINGASNAALGGKFEDGFISGVAGGLASFLPTIGTNPFSGLIQKMVIGGTLAEIGGGKFSNGAATAAFQYMATVATTGGFTTYFNETSKIVYPKGMPSNPEYYKDNDGFINIGIGAILTEAQGYADEFGIPFLANPSQGLLHDLLQSGLSKVLFGYRDSARISMDVIMRNGGFSSQVRLFAHSQGSLFAVGLAARGALPSGSELYLQGPAANYFTARAAGVIGGYSISYEQKYGDIIGLVSFPHPNILKNLLAPIDIPMGARNHTDYNYYDFSAN